MNNENIESNFVYMKPFRFYWSWPENGDKWFYSGPNFIGRYKNINQDLFPGYTTFYGWHIWIGPLHFVFCSEHSHE